jgi:PAS domain S-box-containing protein
MAISVRNGFHESEEGYRLLFESNPQPMWIYDRDTLRFLEVNHAAVCHYGYSREEFLSMTLKEIRPPQDVPSLCKKVAAIQPGMNSASSRHLKKDGTVFSVEIVSHTLQFNGKRAELVLAMDVSDGRRRSRADEPTNFLTGVGLSEFEDKAFTETERRVAALIARGFSNKQIAAALEISVRTVENHVSHILNKKSFANRVEIARYVWGRTHN